MEIQAEMKTRINKARGKFAALTNICKTKNISKKTKICTHFQEKRRADRGWLSHGLVVTLPISYSPDGGTLWGFTRDMRIAD